MNTHPNLSAPTPEAGPTVGASPVHGRTRRSAVLVAAGFAVLVGGAMWLGSRITSVLIEAAPDQSEQGIDSLLTGLAVVGVALAFALAWLILPSRCDGRES